jgi:hypothetical protein
MNSTCTRVVRSMQSSTTYRIVRASEVCTSFAHPFTLVPGYSCTPGGTRPGTSTPVRGPIQNTRQVLSFESRSASSSVRKARGEIRQTNMNTIACEHVDILSRCQLDLYYESYYSCSTRTSTLLRARARRSLRIQRSPSQLTESCEPREVCASFAQPFTLAPWYI